MSVDYKSMSVSVNGGLCIVRDWNPATKPSLLRVANNRNKGIMTAAVRARGAACRALRL
jgi:hypothetical protein